MVLHRDLLLIYTAAGIRAFSIGLLGVVLGVYLSRAGFDATHIGLVLAIGLAGATAATAFVALRGGGSNHKRTLCVLAFLSSLGGIGFSIMPSLGVLLVIVFVGMVNGMGTDRSAAFALEQALVPNYMSPQSRTWALSFYNVVLDASGAFGALAGGIPLVLQTWQGIGLGVAYRSLFIGYAVLQVLAVPIYSQLSRPCATVESERADVSRETRVIVRRLAALFTLDSFGGGFLGDALVTYWFFLRFGLDEKQLGLLFFFVHLLNATSHLGAAWLSRRIGLVNTMVFTHLPSSLLLLAVPLAPSVTTAIVLFLLRESLVEMDVPTRQSYVAAIVKPHERAYASGITNLTRTIAWASASAIAGTVMNVVSLSGPLVLGGGSKIAYDLLLYRSFRHLKAPEEISHC